MENIWYKAKVVHGLHNGSKFGFPTLNLSSEELPIVENGVYSTVLNINNQLYKGMLYVGTRPTLHLTEKTFEIHVIDFNKIIYDETISFTIVEFIRAEQRFENVENLIKQLQIDKDLIDSRLLLCDFTDKDEVSD